MSHSKMSIILWAIRCLSYPPVSTARWSSSTGSASIQPGLRVHCDFLRTRRSVFAQILPPLNSKCRIMLLVASLGFSPAAVCSRLPRDPVRHAKQDRPGHAKWWALICLVRSGHAVFTYQIHRLQAVHSLACRDFMSDIGIVDNTSRCDMKCKHCCTVVAATVVSSSHRANLA